MLYSLRNLQRPGFAHCIHGTCDCDDKGTLSSLSQTNLRLVVAPFESLRLINALSTEDQFEEWVQTFFLPTASEEDLNLKLMNLYPSDPTEGSPFDTSSDNAITPQFNWFSSFLGDTIFQGPRRFSIQGLYGRQDVRTVSPLRAQFRLADMSCSVQRCRSCPCTRFTMGVHG